MRMVGEDVLSPPTRPYRRLAPGSPVGDDPDATQPLFGHSVDVAIQPLLEGRPGPPSNIRGAEDAPEVPGGEKPHCHEGCQAAEGCWVGGVVASASFQEHICPRAQAGWMWTATC